MKIIFAVLLKNLITNLLSFIYLYILKVKLLIFIKYSHNMKV